MLLRGVGEGGVERVNRQYRIVAVSSKLAGRSRVAWESSNHRDKRVQCYAMLVWSGLIWVESNEGC